MKLMKIHQRATATLCAVAAAGTLSGCVGGSAGADSAGAAQTTACPFTPDESVTTTARIAYQHIPNGDLIVKDQGLLEACMPKASIAWSKFDSGGDVVQAFGSGSADLGLLGSSPAVKALSAPLDLDMEVVWIYDVIGAAESLVVKDTSITTIQGLQGMTIAVPFSSTSHFSLLTALRSAGMDPAEDVELINLSPDKMLAAWGSEVDAAWVWDPTLTQLAAQGKVITGSDVTAEAGSPTFDLAGATSSFVSSNPDFMSMWTRVQDYASKMVEQDPQAAAVSVAAQLGVTPDEVLEQFSGFSYPDAATQAGPDYFGGGLAATFESTAQFLLGEGEVDAVSTLQHYSEGLFGDALTQVAP